VRCRNGHSNRDFAHRQRPGPVGDGHLQNLPTGHRFRGDRSDLGLDDTVVSLVLEPRHPAAAGRMVSHRPEKQNGRPATVVGDLVEQGLSDDRVGSDVDAGSAAGVGYGGAPHTILPMPDTTGGEGEFFAERTIDRLPEPPPEPFESQRLGLEIDPIQPPPRRRWPGLVALAVVSALIGGGVAAAVILTLDEDPAPAVTIVERIETQVVSAPVDSTPSNAAEVAAAVLPSIVTVEVDTTGGGTFLIDASGSGVVLEEEGTIVTNNHVIENASAVRVVFADGRTYDAAIVGGDALTDLAVLSIDAVPLTPISIGSSTSMSIGDVTIAIGSPLGLEGGPSVTVGVLSAFDRRVRTSSDSELFGMLQTDAPITRGSSGGALVDSQGRLIGITSAIGVSDVGAEGLGFAIPVEMMQRITEDLIRDGVASHAFLGITGETHYEPQADGALAPAGVEVTSVLDGTAAASAGLVTGDTIMTFDGEQVTTMDGLVVRLRFFRVGMTVTLGVIRDGATLNIDVTLLERPEDA
jgi:putative serine protease PepD